MGDELDLETVGDIISIIEEKVHGVCGGRGTLRGWDTAFDIYLCSKQPFFVHPHHSPLCVCISQVDDSVEALDAAAVEAALSLCEEAVSAGHSLSGPWEAQDLKTSEPGPMVQSDPTHGLQAAAGANPGSLEPQTESGRGEAEEGKDCEGQETVQTNVDQEAVQAQKIWKKAIMLVWRAAANHRYASVFLQSVSEDIAPGYHSIVHRPMDLSAIKKSIEAGQIRTTAEFQRDIMLMFQNAVMYNSSDHDVFHMALEMQRDVLEHVQQFLATQLIMQTSESSISTKSLRGREGGRKPGESVEKVRLDTHIQVTATIIETLA
uniref:Bromodomain-containing protein 8 n=1 Tax=Oncorhynchus kisutch TaxID=8019 RepID=A0A8C7DBJ8_ONCKI